MIKGALEFLLCNNSSIGADCQDIIYEYSHNLNMKQVLDELIHVVKLYSFGINYSRVDYNVVMHCIKAKTTAQKKEFIDYVNGRCISG